MEQMAKVLVVDDDERNLRLIENMLAPLGYEITLANNGEEALEQVHKNPPDVILLDIMMPVMDGFEVARFVRRNPATRTISIVMITSLTDMEARVKALEAGADDFLTKPIEKTELKARVQSLVKIKAYHDNIHNYQKRLESEVTNKTQELRLSFQRIKGLSVETIYRLSRAAEYKDEETGAHVLRMSHYCVALARQMGFDEERCEKILYAAPMHDIGKIGIPDRILLKPGRLEPEEMEIMKQHTTIGARILEGSEMEIIRLAEVIAMTHHEKWNGTGYPERLKGEDIPVEGRISAVADFFDALTSRRPYRTKPFTVEETQQMISKGRGEHFDPDVVEAFFTIRDEIRAIKKRFTDVTESLFIQMTS